MSMIATETEVLAVVSCPIWTTRRLPVGAPIKNQARSGINFPEEGGSSKIKNPPPGGLFLPSTSRTTSATATGTTARRRSFKCSSALKSKGSKPTLSRGPASGTLFFL